MTNVSKASLADSLTGNIGFLSSLIARKPAAYTPEWASTADEAFSLYTRTGIVNLLISEAQYLAEANWPFPSYLDLKRELAPAAFDWKSSIGNLDRPSGKLRLLWKVMRRDLYFGYVTLIPAFASSSEQRERGVSLWMMLLFRRELRSIFSYWKSSPILATKVPMVRDIERTYRKGYWAACLPTALSLLDFVIRTYFGTNDLYVSISTLRRSFEKADVLPSDFKPGFAIWDGKFFEDGSRASNRLATKLEDDLRLPGVLLYSFVRFADDYYGWYKQDVNAKQVLNRHAIQHSATDYWTRENATKLLTFLDLALRLRRPLEVLIHGPNAPWLNEQKARSRAFDPAVISCGSK